MVTGRLITTEMKTADMHAIDEFEPAGANVPEGHWALALAPPTQ